MDPTTVCCPKPHCHARGPTGQDHIGIHSSGVFNVEIRQFHSSRETVTNLRSRVFRPIINHNDLVLVFW